MARRKTWAALILVAPLAGTVVWRRVSGSGRRHVDLFFEDGSMVSLSERSPEGERLLGPALRALSASRS